MLWMDEKMSQQSKKLLMKENLQLLFDSMTKLARSFYMENRGRCDQQVKDVGTTDVFCFGSYFTSPKGSRTKLVIEISLSIQAY